MLNYCKGIVVYFKDNQKFCLSHSAQIFRRFTKSVGFEIFNLATPPIFDHHLHSTRWPSMSNTLPRRHIGQPSQRTTHLYGLPTLHWRAISIGTRLPIPALQGKEWVASRFLWVRQPPPPPTSSCIAIVPFPIRRIDNGRASVSEIQWVKGSSHRISRRRHLVLTQPTSHHVWSPLPLGPLHSPIWLNWVIWLHHFDYLNSCGLMVASGSMAQEQEFWSFL